MTFRFCINPMKNSHFTLLSQYVGVGTVRVGILIMCAWRGMCLCVLGASAGEQWVKMELA